MLRDHSEGPEPVPETRRPEAVQLRARRSPRLVALGILLVVLGGLGAAALHSMSTDEELAVVMTTDVIRGQQLTQADVTVINVPAGLPVERTGGDAVDSVIGQTALRDLPAGAFPLPRHLGEEPIPAGHSLIGLQLGPGRMPGTELPPGTAVQLVSLVEGDDTAHDAVVAESPVLTDDGSGFVIDVIVADEAAHFVARLSATQQLALIAVGEG